jgi:hypothetical protein
MRRVRPRAVLGSWFTSVLEEATSVSHGDYRPGSCPRAEAAAAHLVNLPTNPRVRLSDAETLIASLRDVAPFRESDNPCPLAGEEAAPAAGPPPPRGGRRSGYSSVYGRTKTRAPLWMKKLRTTFSASCALRLSW